MIIEFLAGIFALFLLSLISVPMAKISSYLDNDAVTWKPEISDWKNPANYVLGILVLIAASSLIFIIFGLVMLVGKGVILLF